MAEQVQKQHKPRPHDDDTADAPTTDPDIARIWFTQEGTS